MSWAHGVADAAHGLVAGEHGFQEIVPAGAALGRDGPCGRHDDATRVRHRFAVQVVHLEHVRERGEQKRVPPRVGGPTAVPVAQDLALRRVTGRHGVRNRVEHEQSGRR
jgi:hypothetical protein